MKKPLPSPFRLALPLLLLAVLACAPADGEVTGETASSGQDAATPTAPDIVDRSIAAHGWDALPEHEVRLVVSSRSGSFRVRARPGDVFEYEVHSEVDGEPRTHLWTNDSITVRVGGEEQPLEDAEAVQRAEDFVSARVYFLFLPYRLNDPSARRTDLGTEAWDGEELHKVKVSFAPSTSTDAGSEFLYWFDPESAELRQFAYDFRNGLRFRRVTNPRRIEGMLFYDQENWAQNGRGLSVDALTPQYVEEEMELLSVVELSEIYVLPR